MNITRALLGLSIVLVVVVGSFALYEYTAQPRTMSENATVTSTTASSFNSSPCAPPGPLQPNPLGGGGYVGGAAFTFVGGNSTCVEVGPSAPGSNSTADFAFTLDATEQLYLTMYIDNNGNGTSTLPSGTGFTAAVGSERFPVYPTLQPPGGVRGVQMQTFFTIPAGNTTVHFQASVPNPYQPGAYHFVVLITAWSDSTRTSASYGDEFRANMVAR